MTVVSAAAARDEADAYGSALGIVIAPAAIDPLVEFLETIWGAGRAGDPSFLAAIAHAGNSVLLATRDGAAVGAALGVLGWAGGLHLHSHMVAVASTERSGGIGFAIKLAQRAECLENGVSEMRWTFDPLIRRNAHVNLVKLGAEIIAFHPNFYGTLDDAINGTDATDRFEVGWRLDAPVGAPAAAGPADFLLPAEYEDLRRTDPVAASSLRSRSTAAFSGSNRFAFSGDGYVLA
jgi:predicted GNAT superfamily acetyltransferase